MGFVIVELHRIRVGADRLQGDKQNQQSRQRPAGPQNNNRRQSALLLNRSLCDVLVMRKVFLQTKASSADRSESSLNKADGRRAFYVEGVCCVGAAFQIKW